MKTKFFWFLCFALMWAEPAFAETENGTVYLVGKYKVQGTSYTQTVFFQDNDVSSLAACEKERQLGHSGRWRYFRHIVRKDGGIPFTVNYFCVQTPHEFKRWYESDPYEHIYLIDVRDGLVVSKAETYSACLRQLKQSQLEESHEFFCSTASQPILNSIR